MICLRFISIRVRLLGEGVRCEVGPLFGECRRHFYIIFVHFDCRASVYGVMNGMCSVCLLYAYSSFVIFSILCMNVCSL
jgi:hypothetical protein